MEGNRDWWAETRNKPLLSSRRNQRATLQRCLPAPLRSMAGQMCRKEKLQLPARFPGVPSRSARTPRRLKPPDDGEWEGSVLGLYHNSSGGQLVKTQDLNLLVVLFRPDPGLAPDQRRGGVTPSRTCLNFARYPRPLSACARASACPSFLHRRPSCRSQRRHPLPSSPLTVSSDRASVWTSSLHVP